MQAFITQHPGEIAGLSAALLWALASLMYQQLGDLLKPIMLNLLKGIIAVVALGLSLVILQEWSFDSFETALWLLVISGLVGISLGDTFFFMALNRIGARQMLLLETLSPVMAALIGVLFFAIILSGQQWLGMLITLAGIAWVISGESSKRGWQLNVGLLYGAAASLCQAIGAVLSHVALNSMEISALASAFIRMLVATGLLLPVLVLTKERLPKLSIKHLKLLIPAALIGTFLCLWLQQIALKYTEPAIAQTLLALSPICVLPLVAMLGEKPTLRAIGGAIIAVFGVSLLF